MVSLKRNFTNNEVNVKMHKKVSPGEASSLFADLNKIGTELPALDVPMPASSATPTSTPRPTAHTLLDSMPCTPLQNRVPASPLPLQAATPRMVEHLEDTEYKDNMQILIANIHKANGDWNRKCRELSVTIARCNHTASTANTPLLKELVKWIDKGKKLDEALSAVETKHATGVYVDNTEQLETKKQIASLTTCAKEAMKIKLLMRGVLYCFLALEGLLIC